MKNKQITIYELLPLLRKGWLAMDESGMWAWYDNKPQADLGYWDVVKDDLECYEYVCLSQALNIAPFDGDWRDSLMEVK